MAEPVDHNQLIRDFLAAAPKTVLPGGVTVWTYTNDGTSFNVSVTYNTGTTSGGGTVMHPPAP